MPTLPDAKDNPHGLHHRYVITKANGEPVDPRAEYFVLRLDFFGNDRQHIAACRVAALAWCDAAPPHLRQVADELRKMVYARIVLDKHPSPTGD